jgi:proline iminopeptidase
MNLYQEQITMNRRITFIAGLCIAAIAALSGCQPSQLSPGEGFIDVAGGKVWYRVVSNGTATPLLVIHGACVPSIYLKPLEELAKDRPVIFYDQLTCGRSAGPSDTTLWAIERFVEEIAIIRNKLGLNQIHIYGHSWGTILATEYMLTKPAGVQSLILAGPALSVPRYGQGTEELVGTLPDSIQQAIIENETAGTFDSPEYLSAKKVFYETFFARRQPWTDELNQTFEQVNYEMWKYLFGPALLTCAGAICEYDCTDRLGEVTVPILLTAGEYDEARPATVEYYRDLFPDAEMAILENCGHLTTQDDPETDIKTIRDFLTRVEAR